MSTPYRYPWPASAISSAEMELLYKARETGMKRIPITRLVAEAIRQVYGRSVRNPHVEAVTEENHMNADHQNDASRNDTIP